MPKKSDSRGGGRGWAALGGRTRGAGQTEGGGNGGGRGGYGKMFRGMSRRGGGNLSKNGCAPKLFMLVLPIVAIGTYLFLVLG